MIELEKLRLHFDEFQNPRDSEKEYVLRQLSALDFTTKQKESYSKRHAKTGQWLLEDPDFQNWLNPEDSQHSVLWCPGNPGVGKTVMTSIAINHVTENTGGRRGAIVYVYCDYANALTFSVRKLLGSMLRQLAEQTPQEGNFAKLKIFLEGIAKSREMTEEDIISWTQDFSRNFAVVYMFVDALDECPEIERDRLLTRLGQYSVGNMQIFLTSRFNVNVKERIHHAIRADFAARDHDMAAYVKSKILESRRLVRFTARDPDLESHIIRTIISQADGMFLLAGLQIGALSNQTSTGGVRYALGRLPTDIFTMYDQTLERIRGQSEEDAKLGLRVLSTIFGASRPLKVDELRHALAINQGDTFLDLESLVDLDVVLSVTAGLVVIAAAGPEMRVFRLVHYTLQEYLQINQEGLFPKLESEMAIMCLSYLSLDKFESGGCLSDRHFERHWDGFCFLDYALKYWSQHLCEVREDLMDQTFASIHDCPKILACLQDWEQVDIGPCSCRDSPLDSICFLAAHFQLFDFFWFLMTSRDINIQNGHKETPLIRAVKVGTCRQGSVVHRFSLLDQHAIVQLLLDHNADIDAADRSGRTAVMYALANEDYQLVDILLKRKSPVHAVSVELTSAPLDELIDCGARLDIEIEGGVTPLHLAAGFGGPETVTSLIQRGAPVNIADFMGKTPLHAAVWKVRPDNVKAILRAHKDDRMDRNGRTPLHYAYFMSDQPPFDSTFPSDEVGIAEVLRLLIDEAFSETAIDAYGRVPRDYAHCSTLEHYAGWEGYWTGDYILRKEACQRMGSVAPYTLYANVSEQSPEADEVTEREQHDSDRSKNRTDQPSASAQLISLHSTITNRRAGTNNMSSQRKSLLSLQL